MEQIEPSLRKALRELAAGKLPWPLFLWGPPGVGKSCAALALLDRTGGFYWTAGGLAEDVVLINKGELHYPSGRRITTKGFWQEVSVCELVVLDELGLRARAGDWQYDCVKRLLDAREGLPLIGLSNLTLDQLVHCYDDRVCSRLAAGTIHHLGGEDRRLQR